MHPRELNLVPRRRPAQLNRPARRAPVKTDCTHRGPERRTEVVAVVKPRAVVLRAQRVFGVSARVRRAALLAIWLTATVPTGSALGARQPARSVSGNWAGYAVTGRAAQPFTHVSGSWVVPRVSCGGRGPAFSVLWVGLEYVRAHILSGFPWYYLAHTQHRLLPMIQIADLAGALGLSFLIALVNAWLVDLRTLPLLRPTPRGRKQLECL